MVITPKKLALPTVLLLVLLGGRFLKPALLPKESVTLKITVPSAAPRARVVDVQVTRDGKVIHNVTTTLAAGLVEVWITLELRRGSHGVSAWVQGNPQDGANPLVAPTLMGQLGLEVPEDVPVLGLTPRPKGG